MKRLLMVLAFMVCSIPAFAWMETTDVQIDSYTFKTVQISTMWTQVIDRAEISVSSPGATATKLNYTLVGWQGRHLDTSSDMAIVTDTMTNVNNVIPLKGVSEIWSEKACKLPMSARLKTAVTGTVTFYMIIGYHKY